MTDGSSHGARRRPRRARALLHAAGAGALGVAAALLVACGSSSKGLIPTANAGPLQSDFELVAQAAQSGNGNCTATEIALVKTIRDLNQLPASVDAGLRRTLNQGVENLRTRALALCSQHARHQRHDRHDPEDDHRQHHHHDHAGNDADPHADDASHHHAHRAVDGHRRRDGCPR